MDPTSLPELFKPFRTQKIKEKLEKWGARPGFLALDRTRGGDQTMALGPKIQFCRFYQVKHVSFTALPGEDN